MEVSLSDDFDTYGIASKEPASDLMLIARRYKVDAVKIRAQAEEQLKEAEGGTRRAVVIQTTKVGYVWVLDRDTGEPVVPVKEMPVPASDVPGDVEFRKGVVATWPRYPAGTHRVRLPRRSRSRDCVYGNLC